ncbi:MAG: class I SAM-dependent methyltransferase [Planctomycetaceae bacterium]|nr:MAG: class I SAM-dependent methyltransferase [Planctomycetaceae bacterium]
MSVNDNPIETPKPDWRELWRLAGNHAALDVFTEPLLELAVKHLADTATSGGTLLDVGCGRGRNAELFRRLGMDVTGIDLDESSLASARQSYPLVKFQTGDIQALPFADETFDAVFSFSVLQYVDWPAAIRQCRRVLKPGGKAVFIENLRGNPIAMSYRLMHKIMGWRYGKYQTPKAHIDWKQLGEFSQVFSNVDIRTFHLTTPAALVWPALRRHLLHKPFELKSKFMYRGLQRIDDALLRHFSHLRKRCWLMAIMVTK